MSLRRNRGIRGMRDNTRSRTSPMRKWPSASKNGSPSAMLIATTCIGVSSRSMWRKLASRADKRSYWGIGEIVGAAARYGLRPDEPYFDDSVEHFARARARAGRTARLPGRQLRQRIADVGPRGEGRGGGLFLVSFSS